MCCISVLKLELKCSISSPVKHDIYFLLPVELSSQEKLKQVSLNLLPLVQINRSLQTVKILFVMNYLF